MIEERGRVVASSPHEAWVQTMRQSTCNACSAQKACGQKLLNSMSSGRAQQIKVANLLGVRVGEEVVVGIPESSLLKASLVVYLIPLLAMIAAAVFAREILSVNEGWGVLAGFVGLAVGFFLARRFSAINSDSAEYHPKLLRRASLAMELTADGVYPVSPCSPQGLSTRPPQDR